MTISELRRNIEQTQAGKQIALNSLQCSLVSPLKVNSEVLDSISKDKKKGSETTDKLSAQIEQVKSGDLSILEEILLSQAVALNAFAADLLVKASSLLASGQCAGLPELLQTLTHLGLKAQDQSRKAVLALHEVRNPKKPAQFVKTYINQQLNQQLNQLRLEQEQNQQLEAGNAYGQVESGSQKEAVRIDQEMEALGGEHGSQVARRENHRSSEQP